MSSKDEVEVGDAVSAELTAMLARLTELADTATDPSGDGGAALIDRIATLEQMRAALAAAQHTAMVAFARTQVDEQAELSPRAGWIRRRWAAASPTRSRWPPTSHPGRARGG